MRVPCNYSLPGLWYSIRSSREIHKYSSYAHMAPVAIIVLLNSIGMVSRCSIVEPDMLLQPGGASLGWKWQGHAKLASFSG